MPTVREQQEQARLAEEKRQADQKAEEERLAKEDRDENLEMRQKQAKRELSLNEVLANQASGEIDNSKTESNIVHRVQVPDGQGGIKDVQHGPMPVSEWPDYQRENGL